jgi:hypothetical protein
MRTALLAPATSEQPTAWPLLVLDAGTFLARCRECGWTSPAQSTLEAAVATFETHLCWKPSR